MNRVKKAPQEGLKGTALQLRTEEHEFYTKGEHDYSYAIQRLLQAVYGND